MAELRLSLDDQVLVNALAALALSVSVDRDRRRMHLAVARSASMRATKGHPYMDRLVVAADGLIAANELLKEGTGAAWAAAVWKASDELRAFFEWRLGLALEKQEEGAR
jgi:hypothetical protein